MTTPTTPAANSAPMSKTPRIMSELKVNGILIASTFYVRAEFAYQLEEELSQLAAERERADALAALLKQSRDAQQAYDKALSNWMYAQQYARKESVSYMEAREEHDKTFQALFEKNNEIYRALAAHAAAREATK